MPKESESFNKNDKNSSEMIVFPQNNQVEEVLISDEEQIDCDTQSYESKLNDKLRDLDLYEDGMTIQQKEELLAVVVASWETAEKEKTRRQFFQDYMNASGAFCNDDIEFSFQEPAELSNDASLLPTVSSCLDVTLSVDNTNVCYSGDSGTNSLKANNSFNGQSKMNEMTSDSSLETCENENICTKSYELETYSFRETKTKGRSSRRGKPKRGRLSKQSVGVACVVNSYSSEDKRNIEAQEITNKQSRKQAIEKSMSSWKPCLSPKDTPLVCLKRPWLEETASPHAYTEQDCSKKILQLVKEFDFARRESKELWNTSQALDKPYHLSRRVHFTKRSNKMDKYDIVIGVPSKRSGDTATSKDSSSSTFVKNEPFSRTSGGAFRYVKSHRNRSNAAQPNFEAMTTRSGTRYGFNAFNQNSNENTHKVAETKDSLDSSFSKELGPQLSSDSPSHLFNEVEVILHEKLPHFNNLRSGLSNEGMSFVSDTFDTANGPIQYPSSSRTSTKSKSHSFNANLESQNHVVKPSYAGSDSSDSSSVIDVETIGDDEIEEFILKRKMLQEFQSIDKEPSASQSKRLKKSAS